MDVYLVVREDSLSPGVHIEGVFRYKTAARKFARDARHGNFEYVVRRYPVRGGIRLTTLRGPDRPHRKK